jgi:hypothetical protein
MSDEPHLQVRCEHCGRVSVGAVMVCECGKVPWARQRCTFTLSGKSAEAYRDYVKKVSEMVEWHAAHPGFWSEVDTP